MQFVRTGQGRPIVLVHGLGGSARSWDPILDRLAAERDVYALDLPGFGTTPALPGPPTMDAMTDAVATFLNEHGLSDADAVGSSMGARLVLELARRGACGSVVALDPGGFWQGAETALFKFSISLSLRLVLAVQPLLPFLLRTRVGRTLLLAQFSARPWALPSQLLIEELQNYPNSPSFEPMIGELARGPMQRGATPKSDARRVTIGWGRYDRVTFPSQAARAQIAFPKATLHWFEHSGHFPMWDSPAETADLILASTRGT